MVRDFAWRGSKDVVPTKTVIRKRIYYNETENILHVISDCAFAKEAWASTNFVLPMDCLNASFFWD